MSDVTRRSPSLSATEQVVLFDLAGARYAMDIRAIEEIIELQDITGIPEAEPWVEGTTLFRDMVVPVLDMRCRFGLEKAEPTDDSRIVVVTGGSSLGGFIVDAVLEVIDVPARNVEPLSDFVSSATNSYLAGVMKIEDRLVCLVDAGRLVPSAAA